MIFLVGYNGSKESRAALALAREHAVSFKAKVFIVASTFGGAKETPADIDKAEQDLAFAGKFMLEKNIEYECFQLVRGMTPGEDLVRMAEEKAVDQIYVGIEKRSRTQKILLGSNAQFIILKAPCPVVTVNADATRNREDISESSR